MYDSQDYTIPTYRMCNYDVVFLHSKGVNDTNTNRYGHGFGIQVFLIINDNLHKRVSNAKIDYNIRVSKLNFSYLPCVYTFIGSVKYKNS